jgi:hypothetical protein
MTGDIDQTKNRDNAVIKINDFPSLPLPEINLISSDK